MYSRIIRRSAASRIFSISFVTDTSSVYSFVEPHSGISGPGRRGLGSTVYCDHTREYLSNIFSTHTVVLQYFHK